jgi:hypothetical protein
MERFLNKSPFQMEASMRQFLTVSALTLSACLTLSAQGATLLTWETGGIAGGGPSPTTLASATNDANLLASTLTAGSGLTAFDPNDAGRFQFTSWDTSGVLATAMAAGDYLEFTITPVAGYQFTLTDLDIYWRNRAGTTAAYTIVLASSLDSYATSIITPIISPAGNAQQSAVGVAISGVTDVTSATIFRLAVLGVDSTGRPIGLTGNASGPELRLIGSVALVPEPGSLVLMATGAALLVIRRRQWR